MTISLAFTKWAWIDQDLKEKRAAVGSRPSTQGENADLTTRRF